MYNTCGYIYAYNTYSTYIQHIMPTAEHGLYTAVVRLDVDSSIFRLNALLGTTGWSIERGQQASGSGQR